MYLHEGHVLLKSLPAVPKTSSRSICRAADSRASTPRFTAKSAHTTILKPRTAMFRAPETGRGDVHALYYRVAALVNAYYGDYEYEDLPEVSVSGRRLSMKRGHRIPTSRFV